jgi:hypothetical protein
MSEQWHMLSPILSAVIYKLLFHFLIHWRPGVSSSLVLSAPALFRVHKTIQTQKSQSTLILKTFTSTPTKVTRARSLEIGKFYSWTFKIKPPTPSPL